MTVQVFANLFNVTGIGLILLVSLFVLRTAPSPFFRAWLTAYGAGLLMLVVDTVSQQVGRPVPLTLLEIGCAFANASFLLETGDRLQARPSTRRLQRWGFAPLALVAALPVFMGQPYNTTFILPCLTLSAAFIWLGAVLLRQSRAQAPWIHWLAFPLIGTGLLPLTYPLMAATPVEWLGYWLGGILNLTTGMGMVVYLLQETAGQLQQQNEKLRQLDQLKRNFISTVSHELRTPLTSVMGYLEFLEDRIGGPLTHEQAEFVERMKEGSSQLAELIDSLLDSHQMEAGALQIKHEEVDLAQILDQVLNTLRSLIDKKGLHLEVALDPTNFMVWGDARRVVQVLNNLIGNAIKFTATGGTIRFETRVEGDMLRVAVRDTGIGIPHAQLARIFDPFFQVDSGLVREHSGSGLGLSIVRTMIQAMGGQVGVESEEGKGSVFCFTLPLSIPPFIDEPPTPALESSN